MNLLLGFLSAPAIWYFLNNIDSRQIFNYMLLVGGIELAIGIASKLMNGTGGKKHLNIAIKYLREASAVIGGLIAIGIVVILLKNVIPSPSHLNVLATVYFIAIAFVIQPMMVDIGKPNGRKEN